MLARPIGNGGAPALEWYPPGRLVVWAAVLAALVVVVAIPNFGTDADSFHAGLRGALMNILRVETDTPADATPALPGVGNAGRLVDFVLVGGQTHELAPSLQLLKRLPRAPTYLICGWPRAS